jgi:hypothetical protein
MSAKRKEGISQEIGVSLLESTQFNLVLEFFSLIFCTENLVGTKNCFK